MKKLIVLCMILSVSFFFFSGCASTGKRLDANKDIVADSGELTRIELERSAERLAKDIGAHFKKNPNKNGVFVALLPTKNNTSEQLSTDVFDNNLVGALRKNGVYTIRTETRDQALSEIQFSMTGLTEKPLSLGTMKSPNYFIKTDILENMFKHGGDKIVEQVINTELIELATQIVIWSDKSVYRKQAVSGGGVGW